MKSEQASPLRLLLSLIPALLLAGCTLDGGNPGIRVTLLVLVPAGVIGWILWRLALGGRGRPRGRPDLPDQDDRE